MRAATTEVARSKRNRQQTNSQQEVSAEQQALVQMDVVSPTVVAGEQVTLAVRIDDARSVASVPFHIVFDPGFLEFVGVTEGSFLRQDGQPTALLAAPTSDRGRIVVGLSRLGDSPGMSGSGPLCSLTFRARAYGSTTVRFERAKVVTDGGTTLPARFIGTELHIK